MTTARSSRASFPNGSSRRSTAWRWSRGSWAATPISSSGTGVTSRRTTARRATCWTRSRPSCGADSAFDLTAPDDRVAAVRVAHPGLVRAVVVRAEQDQRRLRAPDAAGLVPFRIEPAPDADERVLLPLVADRRRQGVTGMDA